ncbi:MAG TPA: TonB-dependent receptor [Steroidobacteraceae bacterium]|jgi:TonB-dependent receptor
MSRKTRRNASKSTTKQLQATADRLAYARLGMSGLALGSMAFGGSVLADDAPSAAASPSPNELSEITVTGIRASLQRSLDVKQNSTGVVDAISAEDIGQFPDSNMAEAMQRIPGVTVSRGTSSLGGIPGTTGDGTEITVRGFGPTYSETLYDGRPVATGTSDRGFDFSSVSSDFVGEVDVLKTPDLSLSSGAIGATVNIKFPKPFDYDGLKFAASGAASDNTKASKVTPNGGALISDTFFDHTFGILVDAAYTDHKGQDNHINIQGWPGFLLAPSQLAGAAAGASTTGSIPAWEIQDYGIYQENTEDERVQGRLAIQWRPVDSLLVTLNDDYSRDQLTNTMYGYSVWFNPGAITDAVQNRNGTLVSYVQPNTPTDFQGQIDASVIQNNLYGLNVAWDVTDKFKAILDADQSNSKLNPNGQLSSIDADVGYGGSGPGGSCLAGTGLPICNSNNVGIAGIGVGSLPYPTGYGPNGNTGKFINNGVIGSHVLPISLNQNDDTIDQMKIEGDWKDDHFTAKIGFQYVYDKKDIANYSDFVNNEWQNYAGYGPGSDNAGGVALPQSFFSNSFSTGSGFINGFNNGGLLPPGIIKYNPYTVLHYLEGLGNPNAMNIPGFNYASELLNPALPPGVGNTYYTGQYTTARNAGLQQTIQEKTMSPFVHLDEDMPFGSMTLKTSLGARYERTDVTSTGLGQEPTSLTVQAADHTAFLVGYGPISPVVNRSHYSYLLPSLDLNLDITRDLKVRFDASRTLTRPPLSDITPVTVVNQGLRTNSLVATGGNPNLLPYLSDNVDLGVEWYYARNSYISVDAFVKELTNFIVGGTTVTNINGVTDPTRGGAPAQFSITSQVNGPSAEVRGVEIGLQHMLWDTGFGVQANATFVGTDHPYNPNNITQFGFAVTGLTNSANFVAFFEKWGFHARVALNWRGAYLDHFGQTQNTGNFGDEPTFVNSDTEVDFSTSYDIGKHFDVFLEGQNVNNSTYSTHGRFPEQVLDVIDYGSRYTLGAHFRM